MPLSDSFLSANLLFHNHLMEFLCCRMDSVELKPELRAFYGTRADARSPLKENMAVPCLTFSDINTKPQEQRQI